MHSKPTINSEANNKCNLVIEIMIVMGENEEVVDDGNHSFKEVLKSGHHGLLETETGMFAQ